MSGTALLAGLLQGLSQGQREKEERKERAEDKKLQKQLMDYKIKSLDQKAKMNDYIINLLQGQQGGMQPPATDEGGFPISTGEPAIQPVPMVSSGDARGFMPKQPPSTGPSGDFVADPQFPNQWGLGGPTDKKGIVDMLAGSGMPQIDPVTASLLKSIGGPDFTALPRAAEARRHNLAVEEAARERIDWQKGAVTPVKEKIPGRGTVTRYVPEKKLREGGAAFQTGLPETETHQYEEKGTTYSVIRNKRTGEEITKPVPIKEQKPLATETAGKLTLSINAQSIAKTARDMVIDPETGEINKQILFEAAAPMGGVGQGRALRSMFMDALDARIRAATGAAVTKEEWPAYFRMYLPGPLDLGSPGLIKDKLDRLDSFIDKYITSLDPSGAMRKTIGKEGGVDGPKVGTVEDGYRFKGGDPSDQKNWELVK